MQHTDSEAYHQAKIGPKNFSYSPAESPSMSSLSFSCIDLGQTDQAVTTLHQGLLGEEDAVFFLQFRQ